MPTVGTDHALTDRQAEARALSAAIATSCGIEHIEDLCTLILGNPRPLIGHGEKQLVARYAGAQLQSAMGRRKARRVFQHIDQRLFDQRRMHIQQR